MKGQWKSKLSGYSKDIRRKKQTHKHMLRDNAMFISKHFMEGCITTHPDVFKEDVYSEEGMYQLKKIGRCLYQITDVPKWFTYENNSKFFYGKPAYIHEKWTWTRKERKEYPSYCPKYNRNQTKFRYDSSVDYDNEVSPVRQTNCLMCWD